MERYPLLYYVVPRHLREIKQPVSLNIHFNVTKGENLMEFNKAINIAVGCVMTSSLDRNEKQEVIESLRKLEMQLEEANEDRAILTEVINTSNYADELNNVYERLKALCED